MGGNRYIILNYKHPHASSTPADFCDGVLRSVHFHFLICSVRGQDQHFILPAPTRPVEEDRSRAHRGHPFSAAWEAPLPEGRPCLKSRRHGPFPPRSCPAAHPCPCAAGPCPGRPCRCRDPCPCRPCRSGHLRPCRGLRRCHPYRSGPGRPCRGHRRCHPCRSGPGRPCRGHRRCHPYRSGPGRPCRGHRPCRPCGAVIAAPVAVSRPLSSLPERSWPPLSRSSPLSSFAGAVIAAPVAVAALVIVAGACRLPPLSGCRCPPRSLSPPRSSFFARGRGPPGEGKRQRADKKGRNTRIMISFTMSRLTRG